MNLSSLSPTTSTPSELYAVLLKLCPTQGGPAHTLMPFSGDLVHGAFFSWIRSVAPSVATALHDGNKRRLFTCSSLQFPLPAYKIRDVERTNTHLTLRTDTLYTIRVTLLLDNLLSTLYNALTHVQEHQTPEQPFIYLSQQGFLLERMIVSNDASEWTGITTFQQLVESVQAEHSLQTHSSKVFPLTLEFNSLTTFHRNNMQEYGQHYAMIPLPFYIFPMLASRWNELAPPHLISYVQREQVERYIHDDGLVIFDYSLQPHRVTLSKGVQRGFIGTCTYHMRGPDNETTAQHPLTIRQQLLLLARFAFYTGIGYRTAMGMGRARVL